MDSDSQAQILTVEEDRFVQSVLSGRHDQQRIDKFLSNLPRLSERDLRQHGDEESLCPICFTPLLALLAEEESALAMDSPAHPLEELGVTKLSNTCGHIFCRKDISKWIRDGHHSCPACRQLFSPESNDSRSLSLSSNMSEETQALFRRNIWSTLLETGPFAQFVDPSSNEHINRSETDHDAVSGEYAGMYS